MDCEGAQSEWVYVPDAEEVSGCSPASTALPPVPPGLPSSPTLTATDEEHVGTAEEFYDVYEEGEQVEQQVLSPTQVHCHCLQRDAEIEAELDALLSAAG